MRQFCWLIWLLGSGQFLYAQQIQQVNKSWIENIRNNTTNDTLYIINFWATWCKPCVAELPYFEQLHKQTQDKKIRVVLVSNDTKKALTDRLPLFISDKQIQSRVLFMNETNANDWIEMVSKNWSGAIPATWLVKASLKQEAFHEGELTFEKLNELVKQFK
jgi:thiol-disulfide isomerase/thioredoxin